MSKLQTCLKKLKAKKAAGPKLIPSEFLKKLPSEWLNFLLSFFIKIMTKEHIPQSWDLTNVSMLYKKNHRKDFQNYRSIALLNAITKLLTKMLNDRLIK